MLENRVLIVVVRDKDGGGVPRGSGVTFLQFAPRGGVQNRASSVNAPKAEIQPFLKGKLRFLRSPGGRFRSPE